MFGSCFRTLAFILFQIFVSMICLSVCLLSLCLPVCILLSVCHYLSVCHLSVGLSVCIWTTRSKCCICGTQKGAYPEIGMLHFAIINSVQLLPFMCRVWIWPVGSLLLSGRQRQQRNICCMHTHYKRQQRNICCMHTHYMRQQI